MLVVSNYATLSNLYDLPRSQRKLSRQGWFTLDSALLAKEDGVLEI